MSADQDSGAVDASAWATLTFVLPSSALVGLEGPLGELAPDGMQVDDASTLTGKDLPTGSSRVILYVPAPERARAEARLQAVATERGLSLEVRSEALADQDWNATWKSFYRPLRVGRRLRVEPVFDQPEADPTLVSVVIDPGMAFGTGTHETTQLAASAVETWIDAQQAAGRDLSAERLLDVGTGSGILSIAALKLGFGAAVGTEIDEPGLENTRTNARLNGVDDRLELHLSETPERAAPERFPLVLANIISSILLRLRPALVARVAPGGTLIVSGVLAEERERFIAGFAGPELQLQDTEVKGDWMSLTWRRER